MTTDTTNAIVPLPQFLEQQLPELSKLLPHNFPAEKFLRQVLTATRVTPRLAVCDRRSFMLAVSNCAALGLEPVGAMQQAHLVPFNRRNQQQPECQLIIGYRGYVALMLAGGACVAVNADCVHQNDLFEYERGTDEFLRHVRAPRMRGPLTHAWAVATMRGGGKTVCVIDREQIDAARAYSRNANEAESPWVRNFPEMCLKTAVRRLAKLV